MSLYTVVVKSLKKTADPPGSARGGAYPFINPRDDIKRLDMVGDWMIIKQFFEQ